MRTYKKGGGGTPLLCPTVEKSESEVRVPKGGVPRLPTLRQALGKPFDELPSTSLRQAGQRGTSTLFVQPRSLRLAAQGKRDRFRPAPNAQALFFSPKSPYNALGEKERRTGSTLCSKAGPAVAGVSLPLIRLLSPCEE